MRCLIALAICVAIVHCQVTLDPAVSEFCGGISTKCTDLSGECSTIRNGLGPVVGAGTMSNQAGNGGVGEQTGGVTLTGNTVVVTATGLLGCSDPGPTICPRTPNGDAPPATGAFVLPGAPSHSLVAKVGAGPWQFVGAGPTAITGTGALMFAYNDEFYSDNWGSFDIKIHADITNVADDCDAAVAACGDMHDDCLDKVASCPLVPPACVVDLPVPGGGTVQLQNWRAGPLGYWPSDNPAAWINRVVTTSSVWTQVSSNCFDFCNNDPNMFAIAYEDGSEQCWCYTTDFSHSVYDNSNKIAGSFNMVALFKSGSSTHTYYKCSMGELPLLN
jgi:hypothetical protein